MLWLVNSSLALFLPIPKSISGHIHRRYDEQAMGQDRRFSYHWSRSVVPPLALGSEG